MSISHVINVIIEITLPDFADGDGKNLKKLEITLVSTHKLFIWITLDSDVNDGVQLRQWQSRNVFSFRY